jgi:hypothetical protein
MCQLKHLLFEVNLATINSFSYRMCTVSCGQYVPDVFMKKRTWNDGNVLSTIRLLEDELQWNILYDSPYTALWDLVQARSGRWKYWEADTLAASRLLMNPSSQTLNPANSGLAISGSYALTNRPPLMEQWCDGIQLLFKCDKAEVA